MLLLFGMYVEADISSLLSTGRGSALRGVDGSDRVQISFRSQGDKMTPELSDKRATVNARIASQRGQTFWIRIVMRVTELTSHPCYCDTVAA